MKSEQHRQMPANQALKLTELAKYCLMPTHRNILFIATRAVHLLHGQYKAG